jgi:hypothetical protein
MGAGVFCDGTSPTLRNNVVGGNVANSSGAGLYARNSSVQVLGNAFVENVMVSGSVAGGALYVAGAGPSGMPRILDNRFLANHARLGSALVVRGTAFEMNGNRIAGNDNGLPDPTLGQALVLGTSADPVSGVMVNNEIIGNSGDQVLVDGEETVLLVNNTFRAGPADGIQIGWFGTHELTNNILIEFAGTAVVESDVSGDGVPRNNLFFGNGADFYDEGTSSYTGGGVVNLNVAGAADNITGDPQFVTAVTDDWSDDSVYDPATLMTTLTDVGGIPGGEADGYVGWYVNPDVSQHRRFLIVASDATGLTVYGDASGLGTELTTYTVETLRIPETSAAQDAGSTSESGVPDRDIEGDLRPGPDGFLDIGSDESDRPAIGDRVWEDLDADGLQDPGEPGIVAALVYLFDATGSFVDVTFTDTNGNYYFFDLDFGASYFLRFIPPVGYTLTARDQGADDEMDSDADPASGDTTTFSPSGPLDVVRWDAGMVSSIPCFPPDEAIYLYNVTLSTDGNEFPVLHFMNFNQPDQVTGYNIYRSSDPVSPPSTWLLLADDIVDGDEATPNNQWVDISGDVSPSEFWYYHVTAYNHRCPAEGPF